MSTIAETQDTPKQGGFLSRLFNKIAETFNDIKNEYKSGMEKVRQENEYDRQSEIQSHAQAWIKSGLDDEQAMNKMIDFLGSEKSAHQFGKIDAAEVLLMVQKIKAGEVIPRVEVELTTTLEA